MAKASTNANAKPAASKSTAIAKPAAASSGVMVSKANLPAHLQKETLRSVAPMRKFIVPPRLKVVQKTSSAELRQQFEIGDVILVPQNILVAKNGDPFYIVPLFFYVEYCVWNPWLMKDQLPTIRARSLDYDSEIAQKSRNPEAWEEPCPENPKLTIRYCEHLNWIVMLREHPLAGMPFLVSFHHSGHKDGNALSSLLTMRGCEIYGCAIQFITQERNNAKGDWIGLLTGNPSEESKIDPFIQDAAEYAAYEQIFEQYSGYAEKGDLQADYGEAVDAEVSAPANSKGKF